MAIKDIYLNAIQEVIDGKMSKEDLYDVMEEHFKVLNDKINKLEKKSHQYEVALSEIKKTYDDQKKYFNHEF